MSDLDTISEGNLSGVAPALRQTVEDVATALADDGVWIRIVSGLRTAAQQDALYAQGRSRSGKIVTNAKAGQSMHNYGLAVDVVPFLIGRTGALNWKSQTEQFQHMVTAFKEAGLEWGGDWKGSLGDFDHFQMAGLKPSPTPEMQADYGTGSTDELSAIWTKAASGRYSV